MKPTTRNYRCTTCLTTYESVRETRGGDIEVYNPLRLEWTDGCPFCGCPNTREGLEDEAYGEDVHYLLDDL